MPTKDAPFPNEVLVNAEDAERQLAELLAQARSGACITIQVQNRPVARLVPVNAPSSGTATAAGR